jgi:site-specific recombinase XerD
MSQTGTIPSTGQRPRLLVQVREALRARYYSLRTEDTYVQWIKRFILFHQKRHPREMGAEEINQFLTDLAVSQRVASATQNQALSAVLFLYKVVLHQDVGPMTGWIRAKKPKKLPAVLSDDEVRAVLQGLSSP